MTMMAINRINYQIPCCCGHKGENHAVKQIKLRFVRATCLLCDCRFYKPAPDPAPVAPEEEPR